MTMWEYLNVEIFFQKTAFPNWSGENDFVIGKCLKLLFCGHVIEDLYVEKIVETIKEKNFRKQNK